jgi:DNA-binding NarL/FixJ family response regulator
VTTVVIVDNDQYVCDSLQARLGREPDFECVGTAGWPEAARKLAQDARPDLIVLDIMLGGGGDPIDLAADLIKLSLRGEPAWMSTSCRSSIRPPPLLMMSGDCEPLACSAPWSASGRALLRR